MAVHVLDSVKIIQTNSIPYNFISKNTKQYKNGLVVSLMSTEYNIKMLKN